jgi:nicotinamide-nucleotide amidase
MEALIALAGQVVAVQARAGCRVVTAESCTGGLIAACLTAVAGSSAVVERGYVTYSNQAKEQDLGVPGEILAAHGAVSAETAAAMALGALNRSPAELAVAVTGIAGPGGGSPEKPVGLVYLALAGRGGGAPRVECHRFVGDRAAVRYETVRRALELLLAVGAPEGGEAPYAPG